MADVIVGAPNCATMQGSEGIALVVLPEPGRSLALASGIALLAALARRRSKRSNWI